MPTPLASIAFTPAVRAEQQRHGSRQRYARLDTADSPAAELGEGEAAFIAERDTFHMATVSDTGWPYVQHRGGLPGFLQVLDPRTLAFADLRGNAQYLSVGHLAGNPRVSLILMDLARRQRLKIWGTARVVEAADDPALMARLRQPGQRVPAERAVVITVAATDWNCPSHITPRFTEAEVAEAVAPLREELARLKAEVASLTAAARPSGRP